MNPFFMMRVKGRLRCWTLGYQFHCQVIYSKPEQKETEPNEKTIEEQLGSHHTAAVITPHSLRITATYPF